MANHHSVSSSFSERTFLESDGGDGGGSSVGKVLAVRVWRPVSSQMSRTQKEVPEVCICTASATRGGDQAGEPLEPFKLRPVHLSQQGRR